MTKHSDVQAVLDKIKAAQQKPFIDPQLSSNGLEKSTFSESASAVVTAWLGTSGSPVS